MKHTQEQINQWYKDNPPKKRVVSVATRAKSSKSHMGLPSGNKGKHHKFSDAFKKQVSERMTDEKHPQWKGDAASYSAKHHWIKKKLGSPNACVFCRTTAKRQYDWASISHKHLRELDDWIRLCRPCHRRFDKGREK